MNYFKSYARATHASKLIWIYGLIPGSITNFLEVLNGKKKREISWAFSSKQLFIIFLALKTIF